ncbi:nuclear localization sequence-binding protein-like [Lucilia sericata]|uniref:nuclear localization sequence-binding protein-like n=1 Tax=Lucilia sericata TaxID=13632 RepID=UPI0018A84D11|nr:nuclear localization sequence-binding protein-like [Lucilia sericata]
MLKLINLLVLLSIFLILNEKVLGKPQDLQTAALMAAGQIKDTIDNGAAAKDNKEFELFGAKVKTGMEIGFGDAMKSKRSTDDSSSSSESDERRKRSVEQDINGIEEEHEEEEENLYDEDYSYSDYSSSSSSSSESQETKVLTKRSLNLNNLSKFKNSDSFEQFNNDLMNMYLQKQ